MCAVLQDEFAAEGARIRSVAGNEHAVALHVEVKEGW
jgi:hypothetical protein